MALTNDPIEELHRRSKPWTREDTLRESRLSDMRIKLEAALQEVEREENALLDRRPYIPKTGGGQEILSEWENLRKPGESQPPAATPGNPFPSPAGPKRLGAMPKGGPIDLRTAAFMRGTK